MPEKTQTITVTGYDPTRLLAIAYGTLQHLDWPVKYAGDNILLGYTQKSWTKYDDEITIRAENDQLTIASKMIHGESFDLMGRNKKNIAKFFEAFETARSKATDLNINEWNEKIQGLKEDTIKVAEQEIKQAEDVDKVMNLSKGNRYVTYGIIGINALVFVLMVVSGISIISPGAIDIINWGANYGPLTLSGDWWRLISCVFVHIGIIHIAFNMYALYMVGVYLEPMLGKTKYITAYLCTGVFASLASLWWHKDPVPSAGASGAIFGIYGVFLALLSTNLIPKQVRRGLLQSIGIFVVYNLVYGMKSGVDNSAHIGGLLSGLVIGYLYYPGLKTIDKKSMAMPGLVIVVTIAATVFYLQSNKASDETRSKVKGEIEGYKYKDAATFSGKYDSIIEMQNRALVPLKDSSLTDDQLSEKLGSISLPEWENADRVVKELKTLDVSERAKQKAEVMQRYIDLRKEQIRLIRKLVAEKDQTINSELNSLAEKINKTIAELDGQ